MNLNKDAVGRLWDEVTPRLYGYIVYTLKDKVLADDVLQTTWLKAIQSMSRFHDRGDGLSPWLFSIARNEMKMHWRKKGREVRYDPAVHDVSAGEMKMEDGVFMESFLKPLSQEDRELVELRYIGCLSFSEIAKVLNISQISARVRMHRLLSKARNLIKPDYE